MSNGARLRRLTVVLLGGASYSSPLILASDLEWDTIKQAMYDRMKDDGDEEPMRFDTERGTLIARKKAVHHLFYTDYAEPVPSPPPSAYVVDSGNAKTVPIRPQ